MERTILCISLSFLLLLLSGCQKDDIPFEIPHLEITETKVLSNNTCELVVKINLGSLENTREAYIHILDLSDENTIPVKQPLPITSEKEQLLNMVATVPISYHHYKVEAIIESSKNTYKSSPHIIRFSQTYNNDELVKDMYLSIPDYDYFDNVDFDSDNIQRGNVFLVKTTFYEGVIIEENDIKVKLNGTIPVEISITPSLSDTSEEINIEGYLNEEIPSGIYSVHVYINGNEYNPDCKIHILKGRSRHIQIERSSMPINYLVSFIKNSKIYYITNKFEVYTFDLETHEWELKRNVPLDEEVSLYAQPVGSIEDNGIHYLLVQCNLFCERDLSLWEYNEAEDTWKMLTEYPGDATRDYAAFALAGKIYVGGGIREVYYENNINYKSEIAPDFWEYDIENNRWNRKNNIPYGASFHNYVNSTCTSSSNAFVLTGLKDIWKYNPVNDEWSRLPSLRGGSFYRRFSNLLFSNDKLYIVGNSVLGTSRYIIDCWEFDIEKNHWSLIEYCQSRYMNAGIYYPAFFYNEKIYVGYTLWNPIFNFVEIELN